MKNFKEANKIYKIIILPYIIQKFREMNREKKLKEEDDRRR